MSDAFRDAVIAAIGALRMSCEFAPRPEEINTDYVNTWAAAFQDANISPQEIVLSARQYLGTHAHYPAVASVVKIARERRDHRIALQRGQYYTGAGPALPAPKVSDEDRRMARERLGITDLDIKKMRRQHGRQASKPSGSFRSLVDAAKNEVSEDVP